VGVRRETVTKWHKNPFFSAELSIRREELWVDAKLRLKSLAHEAVNVLTKGLSSGDEKVAITAAVHILKTVGLYGELKQGFGPDTPEEAVWDQAVERRLHTYMALRPDAFSDWSEKNHMSDLAKEDSAKMMRYWYEQAVDEQKAEIRQYRRRLKAQECQVEPVPMIIEKDIFQNRGDKPKAIEAR
jgi:hypothetical protein